MKTRMQSCRARGVSGTATVGLTIVGVVLLPVASAGAAEFVYSSSFMSASGAPLNPALLVGFNPQPKPPGSMTDEFGRMPTRLGFRTTSDTSLFGILIGMNQPGMTFQFSGHDQTAPGDDGMVSFFGFFEDQTMLEFRLRVGGSSPLQQGSWRGFNPQPEPPAFPGAIGFEFALEGVPRGGDGDAFFATLSLEVIHDGVPLTWVPTPGAAALLGFAGMASTRRRGRPESTIAAA